MTPVFPRSLALTALAACAWACATAAPVSPPSSTAELGAGVRSFLREPLLGYEGNIPEQSRRDLASAWQALGRSEVEVAASAAETLLEIDPTLLPATVLLAQTHFVRGRNELVVDLLAEPLAERPGYVAGQLVYARAAERTGDPVGAWGAYRGIAATDGAGAELAAALEADAAVELARRAAEALAAGRLADAADALELLLTLAPGEAETRDLRRRLAQARGDGSAELAVTRDLIAAGDSTLELLERRAALELEIGDARAGLELYEQLAEEHPENAEIAAALATARFTWRTRLLPDEVADLLEARNLSRGEFAALTYWLVPGIRGGAPASSVIAGDILDHPWRREIARLLGLGLMAPHDAALRRFAPDNYMRWGPALAALLRMPGRIGGGAACVGVGGPRVEDTDAVCAAAVRCRLIDALADCRPEGAVSGPAAAEALRKTLHLVQ